MFMVNPEVADSAADDRTVPGETGSFSLLRVFAMVVIAVVVAGGGYGVWSLTNAPRKPVAYTGRILYQGKPVVGDVMTQNLDDKFDSAGGTLDEDGRFTLDTNGEPGANVGRHKLAIISFERGAPPRPLVPAVYTNIATTPLLIEITGDSAANHGEFTLEGSVPEPAAAAAGIPTRGSAPIDQPPVPDELPAPDLSAPSDPSDSLPPSEPTKP